jgi:hypothetical protein
VDGAGVDGQAVLAVETLAAVVAHKAGIVLMLTQMGLHTHTHKILMINQ